LGSGELHAFGGVGQADLAIIDLLDAREGNLAARWNRSTTSSNSPSTRALSSANRDSL
jgi:hypothetical protein